MSSLPTCERAGVLTTARALRRASAASQTCPGPWEAAGASASQSPLSQAHVIHLSVRGYLMFDLSPVWKLLRDSGKRRATVRKPPRPRLGLEALADRIVPSTF